MRFTISGKQITDDDQLYFAMRLLPGRDEYKTLRSMGFFAFPDGNVEEFDFDGLYTGHPVERSGLMLVYHSLGPLVAIANVLDLEPEEVVKQLETSGKEKFLQNSLEILGLDSIPKLEQLTSLKPGHIQLRFYEYRLYRNYEKAAALIPYTLSALYEHASAHAKKRGMFAYV